MTLSIRCLRGGLFEAEHAASACLVEGERVRWQVGPDVASFWRSACKPMQLATALECLPGLDLTDEELAVGAASHSGQAAHVEVVTRLLSRLELSADALQCGAHPPMHEPTARSVGKPTVLHNNCSGKHTFMLAASRAQGWDLDYRAPEHPLQRRNRARLDDWAGVTHGVAVDGCSVPTFHAPLSGQARAWARLAAEMADGTEAGRVGLAMSRQPFYMSGDGRLDLAVVTGASEALAVKVGAEGLFCIARPGSRQGIAVKVHTGNDAALAVAVKAVLGELGVALDGAWPWAEVRNVRKVLVGERVAKFN